MKSRMSLFIGNAITIPAFDEGLAGVTHMFGTRLPDPLDEVRGAGSRVHIVAVKQVHGTEALVLHRGMTPTEVQEVAASKGFDAIITDRPRTWLTVRTADCVPILLMDADRGVVASVHAGWRGTVGGISRQVVRIMHESFGCKPGSLRAAIGPSIGSCCYEVDEPVMQPLKRAFPYWSEALKETKPGRGQLDLRRLNRLALQEAGVDPFRIAAVNVCTACHPDLFYSYRRDGKGTRHMTSGIALLE